MKRILLIASLPLLVIVLMACAPAPRAVAPSLPPPALEVAPAPAATAAPPVAPSARESTDSRVPSAASAERMIVYTVRVGIEVQDTEKAVNDVSAIVAQFKGYVAAANMSRDARGRMRGTLTLRVPAEALDAVQKQIEAVGLKVLSRNRTSNDVTDQYTDLDARLKNLEATEAELRKLLETVRERTGKAEDILAVYNRLTEIRGQIEQIKGQMNVLSKTSAMATLTVEITPQEVIQVVEPEGWIPDRTAREALRSLVHALQGLADLAIWGVLFLVPVSVILLLPFVLLALILRGLVRRRRAKKIETPA